MPTLLEIIEKNRKGAGAGNTVSASARNEAPSRSPVKQRQTEQRNLYSQAGESLTDIINRNRQQNLYAQAARSGGVPEYTQQAQEEQTLPDLYAQAAKTKQEQINQANRDFRSGLFGMIGSGLAAQEEGLAQPELTRSYQDYARQMQTAQQTSKELNRAVEWDGRQELIRQYQEAQALAEFEPSRANTERAEAIRLELERKDIEAGNGARSYGLHDRVQNIVRAAEGNVGQGIVGAAATISENLGTGEMMREAGNMEQAGLDARFNDDTRKAAEQALQTEEANAGYQRIHEMAAQLGGSAAEDLQKAKEGLSAFGQMGVDAAENMMEMGFDAALSVIGTPTEAAREIISLGSMFVRTMGSAAEEARGEGATAGEQLLYGLTKGAIEVGTEKLADGIAGIYGKGAADEITEKLIGQLAETRTGRNILRWLIGAASEGGEEVVSELLSPFAEAIYKDTKFKDFVPFEYEKGEDGLYKITGVTVPKVYRGKAAQILNSWLMGAFVGAIAGSGGFVNGSFAAANDALEAGESAARMGETAAAQEESAPVAAAQEMTPPIGAESATSPRGEAIENAPRERGAVDVDLEGAEAKTADQGRFNIVDHNDTAQAEQRLSDAYDQALEENRGVSIDPKLLEKYKSIANDPAQSLIAAVKDYYEHSLKGTTVDVQMNNGVITIMFENDGKRKSVGWRMKPEKAATFEALRQLTENAVYAYSEVNRDENERTSIPYFHYFVNNVDFGNGASVPVKIQTRDIITGNKPGTHYYTHVLENNKARNTGPVSEVENPRIDSNATGESRNINILQSSEESNPQNKGGNSQPIESAENETAGEAGAGEVQAADLSQNEKSAENGTGAERTLEDLIQERKEREQAYMDAQNRGDLDFDYEGEYGKIKELREQAAELIRERNQEKKAKAETESARTEKNETELEMAGVNAKAEITQPTSAVSDSIIRASSEENNPQNKGKASVEVGDERTLHTEEQRAKERTKEQRANQYTADSLADGAFRGIDIMPEEGEEAVSSASGLTEEDNRRLDRGFPASDLFGPTNAAKERAATDRAIKEGNEALLKFAEEMPEDPMDQYGEQNPVSSRKGSGGDDGGDNGNRHVSGQEKISTAKDGEKKTLRQKVSDAWHRFLRSVVNEGDAIHQIGRKTGNKAIDGMYFYAKAATMRAQQWIQKQRTSFDTKTTGKSLNAIFDPIRAKGDAYYEKFQLYLYHMLNAERMSRSTEDVRQEAQRTLNRLAAVNPDIAAMTDETLAAKARQYQEGGGLGYDTENGELIYEYWKAKQDLKRAEKAGNKPVFSYDMSAEESRQTARDLLAENPEFEELAQEVYDYCDALLQYRVDAGLISAEDMAQLKKTYPHYVPVMYDMAEDAGDKVRKGNVSVSSTVKSAKGGTTKMLPLHYALARQTLAVMRNAGYQQLGSAVLNEYEQNGEIMGRYVKDVSENEAVWDESMADNDDVNVPYENVISVFKDGKRYDITLSDELSYAFQSLNPGKNGPQDLKAAMAANNLFKKLCTAYNPVFMITNPIRDVQDALFYSTDTVKWMKNYPKAVAQIAGSGKYWQMYQSLGGVQNSYFDWATGETAGNMGKVEALNLAVEQMPRLAEFMTVLENAQRDHGDITQEDLMEAFNAAAEITTNFSRGGTRGKWINRNLVPFWNPGVQGLSKAVRTVTETRGFKDWATLALKAAALGMLPELLNGLLYKDDEEWDVIDDQMKMDYYLFKTSDGVWIKVPKGRMLAALSMPVVGAQEAARGDDVDWGGLAKSAFGSVAPNNPFETNLLSTALQAKLTNPDDPGKTWYGGNIESKRLQSYAPGERYDESTDYISKWLGGKLGISPKKLNYVIDQYSGILGDLVLPYLTPKAERGLYVGGVAVPLSNAFMSRFTMDTVTNNTISGDYYDMLDELGYAAKGGDKPSAIAERYMNRAGSTITEMYAKIREIENDSNLSDKEKTALTRELRKQLNQYEQQITEDAAKYLSTAGKYLDDHPEWDYTDDKAVDAFVEGYNSIQTDEKYYIDADQAKTKMKNEAYREINREHFGAEYALEAYSKDVYEKAKNLNASAGVSYDDYYDYYFGTRYLYADKDEDGKSISGSKKEKVVSFIDGMDLPDEQKDALYISAGYSEKSLNTTPWHNGSGKYTKGSGRGGSRKGKASKGSAAKAGTAKKSTASSGIDVSKLFGATSKSSSQKANATERLAEIVKQYYGGDYYAAAFDGGRAARRGKTKVDFKL